MTTRRITKKSTTVAVSPSPLIVSHIDQQLFNENFPLKLAQRMSNVGRKLITEMESAQSLMMQMCILVGVQAQWEGKLRLKSTNLRTAVQGLLESLGEDGKRHCEEHLAGHPVDFWTPYFI